jgi:hypothetical protein
MINGSLNHGNKNIRESKNQKIFLYGDNIHTHLPDQFQVIFWGINIRYDHRSDGNRANLNGHNMAAFGWVAMMIAKWAGDPNDTEKLVLPGWLNVMKDSVISYSVIMAFLYTLIGI